MFPPETRAVHALAAQPPARGLAGEGGNDVEVFIDDIALLDAASESVRHAVD